MAKDKKIDGEIMGFCKKLSEERGNPLVLLHLDRVDYLSAIKVEMLLKGKRYKDLDVVLHTTGGLIEPAFNIVKLLRGTAETVNIIIPHHAKSAGTLICLGANKLVMNTIAELGPLDVQIREVDDGDGTAYKSALNGFKALEQIQLHALDNLDIATKLIIDRTGAGVKMAEAIKLGIEFSGQTSGCLYNQLNPKMIGEYARALEVGGRYATVILSRYLGWSVEKASDLSNKLVFGYPSHGFIIDTAELETIGLPAEEVPEDGTIKEILDELKLCLLHKDTQGGTLVELIEKEKPQAPAKKVAKKTVKKRTK